MSEIAPHLEDFDLATKIANLAGRKDHDFFDRVAKLIAIHVKNEVEKNNKELLEASQGIIALLNSGMIVRNTDNWAIVQVPIIQALARFSRAVDEVSKGGI